MQKKKSLILLTNNYPSDYGDTSFIKTEVAILSQLYSSVYIFRFAKNDNFMDIPMPKNVVLFELGLNGKAHILIKGIFNSTSLIKTFQLFRQEYQLLTKLAHLKNLIFATLCGRYFSSKINNLTKKSDQSYDLYAFWGIGSGYSIPWVHHDLLRKTWIRLHGGDLYIDRQQGYIPYRKAIFSAVDVIVPISKQGENYLSTTYAAYNIQTKLFTNYLGSVDYGIPTLPIKTDAAFVIVSCSSVIKLKRVGLIFQSIYLASQSAQIIWHHFGDGSDMPDLRSLVQNTPVSINLQIFFHGQVSHGKVLEFYQENHVDLFINLSETEGIPVSIMEAISFNIPTLATNVGGVGEIINQDFGTGLLIPSNSSAEYICNRILLLQTLTNLYPRDYWSKHFNKIINMNKLVTYLNI